jgi:predicted metal-binding membrane protein
MGSAALPFAPPLPRPSRVGLIGALIALAAGAWVVTSNRMDGMDAGPGTDLGDLGWFAVSWLVMMAAMMLPSLVPAALAFARAGERTVVTFVAGYLAAWTGAGIAAYVLFEAVRGLEPDFLAWHRAGRYVAAGVIGAAAVYQLTTAKEGCLERCRTPLRLLSAGPPGAGGGLVGGLRHGTYCIGCCVGLMAALFSLGVMSLTWMVAVAALIAAERLLPWRRLAVYAVAATLAVLAIWLAAAPGDLPGLTVPGSSDMQGMPGSMMQ